MDKKKHSLIVFCGMDGSGKTTLAKKLAEYFSKQGLGCRLIHGHGYSVSQNSFGLDKGKVADLKYLFRLLMPFAFADNLFTFYFKYKPILRKNNLICDRYFYDKLARMIYFGICSEFIAKIYLKLLPRPDFIFFLDVSPNDAHLRKKEYFKNELLDYRKIYRFLASCLNIPVLDTSQPIDICFKRIVDVLQK